MVFVSGIDLDIIEDNLVYTKKKGKGKSVVLVFFFGDG